MSTIDEIKQRLDIVDIISSYLVLDKTGRNFKALCPFHEEKTPSFLVFPERQSWRCFGCGSGGDLLSFVMKKEVIDFGEALKMLAEKAGVALERKKITTENKLTDRLYRINEEAARYYHDFLLEAKAAELARSYVNKRDLSEKAIADFQLGFSSGGGLRKHLLNLDYGESELLAAGLLREKDGKTYDAFRQRLIFPIRDIKSRVVGFGARALDDSIPKYLNSPQTAVFDKSGILYGIDRAKSAINEEKLAVIVEGYTDVITAHQHGFKNVVASMGTSITEKQIKILRDLTGSLAFALDPDAAGEAATLRGIEIARRSLDREDLTLSHVIERTSKPGTKPKFLVDPERSSLIGAVSKFRAEIKIIPLPRGKDPDGVIKEDPQEWQRLVDEAPSLLEHIIKTTTSELDLTKPEGKSMASEQLLPLIAELQDETQREFYLGKLAGLLGVREKVLLDKAARLHRTPREEVDKVQSGHLAASSFKDPLEEYCLSLLLQHPELRDRASELLTEHFEQSENREIFTAWRDASASAKDELSQMVSIDLQRHLEMLVNKILPPADDAVWEKALAHCVRRLKERRLRLQGDFLTSEGVSMVSAGENLDSADLTIIQKKSVEVYAQLTKGMQEGTGPNFLNREGQ